MTNPYESGGTDTLETQRRQLNAALDADATEAKQAIGEMPEKQPESTEVGLTDVFSADTVRIIRKIYAEKDNPLRQTLREWVLVNLKCTIEEKEGDVVVSWGNPKVFTPDHDSKMRDGTGE